MLVEHDAEDVAERVEHGRGHEAGPVRTWATVLVAARFVPVLRDQFGRHCHPDGERDDDRVRVRLGAPTALDIARHLAGWGALIEVTDPASVRAELARLGTELTARYGDAVTG